jgi:hypothetical protein
MRRKGQRSSRLGHEKKLKQRMPAARPEPVHSGLQKA